jgi:DNA repair ATPase RecN
MPKFNFKLSDDQKLQALWALLNPDCNEEGGWVVSYGIASVYDDYALIINYETGDYERAYYTKNDESAMVEITSRVKCYIVDVTESEKNTLDTLRALNGNTYELVSDVLLNAQETLDKNSEFSAKIEELNGNISTLESEKVNLEGQVADFTSRLEQANNDMASLNEELNSLKEYKLTIETQKKEAVFEEYAEALSEEIIDAYRAKISDYTAEELDMHLAYELKKNNSSIFTKSGNEGYVPKDVPVEGIAAILSKYKK